MQQELQQILKRFQQSYYQSQYTAKGITKYYDDEDNHQFCKQENLKLKNQNLLMQQTIQSLVYYGNRTHKFYESVINETIIHFNALKQEKQEKQFFYKTQIQQAKRTIQQMNENMTMLKRQVDSKQQKYKDLSQKYEELIQRVLQVNEEYQKHIRDIQERYKHELREMGVLVESKEHALFSCQQQQSKYIKQNIDLKGLHQIYKTQIQKISKQKLEFLKQIEGLSSQNQELKTRIDKILQINEQVVCEDKSHLMRFSLSTVKTSKSRGNILHEDTEILNISQHYIQSSTSFIAKFEENEQHLDQPTCKQSRFAKTKAPYVDNRQNQEENKVSKSILQVQARPSVVQDPYRTFFTLLVQAQKLNSVHFNKIASLNISHLYDQFLAKNIPFNIWQRQIKIYLQPKHKQVSKNK